jgi:hypothetical protein
MARDTIPWTDEFAYENQGRRAREAAAETAEPREGSLSSTQKQARGAARKYASQLLRNCFRTPTFHRGLAVEDPKNYVRDLLADEKIPTRLRPQVEKAVEDVLQVALTGNKTAADEKARALALDLGDALYRSPAFNPDDTDDFDPEAVLPPRHF